MASIYTAIESGSCFLHEEDQNTVEFLKLLRSFRCGAVNLYAPVITLQSSRRQIQREYELHKVVDHDAPLAMASGTAFDADTGAQ